jgi:ketosteroid isomerase-like protein
MKKLSMILPMVLILCLLIGFQAQADNEEDVKTAVANVYSAINAKDADTLLQYMAPGGYTEFPEDGSPLFNIDEEYVRRIFKMDWKANFKAQELKVKVFGDAALVTGYRVGILTMLDGATQESRLCLSMMWFRLEGKWKLAHVHLSPSKP